MRLWASIFSDMEVWVLLSVVFAFYFINKTAKVHLQYLLIPDNLVKPSVDWRAAKQNVSEIDPETTLVGVQTFSRTFL